MNIKSVQSRLGNYSKDHQTTHQFTLVRFFQERFLYRLSKSRYRDNFLLKGGALVYVFGSENSRYTKDIDLLLIKLSSSHEYIKEVFQEISRITVDDGIEFSEEVRIDTIQKEGRYTGTRVRIRCNLGNIRHDLQVDIGVGDYVTPGPQEIVYPTLLDDFPAPVLKAYSIETVVSEKFEAMISLGDYNSRLKDFYDIYTFAETADPITLENAIRNTFTRRQTPLVDDHPVFTVGFYQNEKRKKQWQIFLEKNQLSDISFDLVYGKVNTYLKPIYARIRAEKAE